MAVNSEDALNGVDAGVAREEWQQFQGEITHLLRTWSEGDREALNQLMPLVYRDLWLIAKSRLRHENPDHTLQPTALVNEVFLRLTESRHLEFHNRAMFFKFTGRMMRHILVDHARHRRSHKKGGAYRHVELTRDLENGLEQDTPSDPNMLISLDSALRRLEQVDPQKCAIVELRFFVGLEFKEIAELLDASSKTIQRKWQAASMWLAKALSGS
ncbi:Sigma-70 family RNA polymerase sigma factor [Sulfidibacter corallicola]|uniref:Sigma-70 family RNA polymerase sigma factor n=1 Tax=Sulfidibacter corallicola TaxID=2818388 RepID=A0A8A4TFH3_SULCO|nr:ECF-type sigma factor [Sulfidibacter corallicola]QTD48839.1 sigma-70 family RNA polymerase sigma factor [Sulfidibacter corallicola]